MLQTTSLMPRPLSEKLLWSMEKGGEEEQKERVERRERGRIHLVWEIRIQHMNALARAYPHLSDDIRYCILTAHAHKR